MTRRMFSVASLLLLRSTQAVFGCDELEKGAAELARDIAKLTYWRSDRKLKSEEWIEYLRVAGSFQKATHSTRIKALTLFQDTIAKEHYDGIGSSNTKVFLLLRVCFQFSANEPATSGPWVGPKERSMLWPLIFDAKGSPDLLALYRGSGTRYRILQDYMLAVDLKLPPRDLSKIKPTN